MKNLFLLVELVLFLSKIIVLSIFLHKKGMIIGIIISLLEFESYYFKNNIKDITKNNIPKIIVILLIASSSPLSF